MRTPWHLWVVGVLALIWNLGGAFNYLAIKFAVSSVVDQLTATQLAFFSDAPIWYSVAWAVGVWFSVIGCILILMRSRLAGGAFLLSLFGVVGSSIYTFFLAEASLLEEATAFEQAFTAAIFVVLILLLTYSRAMTRRGVLS